MKPDLESDRIEEELALERERLAETIEALNSRVSADALAQQALGFIKTNAGAYTRSIDRVARSNPLALTMTGIGLAWLIFGGRHGSHEPSAETLERWEDEGGSPLPRHLGDQTSRGADRDWASKLDGLRNSASQALWRLERQARSYAGGVADLAADRAKILSSFTEDMRATLKDGLDALSDAARERIIEARQAAYSAHLNAADAVRVKRREAERLVVDHPMVAGALAMAVGAAFAAAMPRTQTEDRVFGEESDRLMDRAAALLREERARMERVAQGVADEIKTSAHELAETAATKAAELTKSIQERAASEVAGPGSST